MRIRTTVTKQIRVLRRALRAAGKLYFKLFNTRIKRIGLRVAVVTIAAVLSLSLLIRPQTTQATILSQGPNSASATGDCTNNAGVGTVAWTNFGNAFSNDATDATVVVDGTTSNYIRCVNFGFSIPTEAAIIGVVVGVDRFSSSTGNGGSNDAAMRIVKGGTIGATDRSTTTTYTTAATYEDHGAANDLWGETLTPTDVNANTFGAAFAATKANAAGPAHTVSVDHIRITVYYEYRSILTTTGYIWENDDEDQAFGDDYNENTQQEAGNTAITNVAQGERITLRTQIKNTGTGVTNSNLALFYDRNDGLWTKVKQATTAGGTSTSGCSDSKWTCQSIDTSNSYDTSTAIDAQGNPWTAYYNGDLRVAKYLGGATNGTGCNVNTWTCVGVDTTGNVGQYTAMAFDKKGNAWVSYYDNTNSALKVATFVGAGGTGCAVTSWTCYTVDLNDTVGQQTSIAIDNSGAAWVSYYDATNTSLEAANFVGSGGNCDTVGGGSDAWQCTTIDPGNTSAGSGNSIAMSPTGKPTISYYYIQTVTIHTYVAEYVGSGGNCDLTAGGSDAWNCTEINGGSNQVERTTSLSFDSAGNPWVAMHSSGLKVARYVGSGGTGCVSSAWTCFSLEGFSNFTDHTVSLNFDPSGAAMLSYNLNGTGELKTARYVVSGGTGCVSSAWTCSVIKGSSTNGLHNSLVFDHNGNPWISYRDGASGAMQIASVLRRGEVTLSAGLGGKSGNSITESHADMTTVSDSANRDDADCIGGGTWNNGKVVTSDELAGLALPAGSGTAQCTEIAFVIDTTQAIPGTTYRFVVASKDGWRPGKGLWRGVLDGSQYASLTIASASAGVRYTKDSSLKFTDSTDTEWGYQYVNSNGWHGNTKMVMDSDGNPWVSSITTTNGVNISRYLGGPTSGTGCLVNTWQCYEVEVSDGEEQSIAISRDNNAWVTFTTVATNELKVAKFLGGATNGTGCAINTWTCTTVDSNSGGRNDIAFDQNGVAWIVYQDDVNSDLKVARYVGGGGTGCVSSEWSCQSVDTAGLTGTGPTIDFDPYGNPWVAYYEQATTSCDGSPATECTLRVAQYLGGGTNGTGCAITSWTCQSIDSVYVANAGTMSIAIDENGKAWIAYHGAVSSQSVAEYLSGATTGTGCSVNTWNCVDVDTTAVDGHARVALDIDGNPWIGYYDDTGSPRDLAVARYLGGKTNGTGCAVNTWNCKVIYTPGQVGNGTSIAFDQSGTPWIASRNNASFGGSFGDVLVLKLHQPPSRLRANTRLNNAGINAFRSDGRYHLNAGYSPRSTSSCSGTADLLGLCGVVANDSSFDSITTTNGRPMFTFAVRNSSSSSVPSVTWVGRSNIAPSTATTTGDIIMEAYNFSTRAWESIASDTSTSDCNTVDCTLTATINNVSQQSYYDWYDSSWWLNIRVWQYENASAETLKTDYFNVGFENTGSQLRGGARFLNGIESGLDL